MTNSFKKKPLRFPPRKTDSSSFRETETSVGSNKKDSDIFSCFRSYSKVDVSMRLYSLTFPWDYIRKKGFSPLAMSTVWISYFSSVGELEQTDWQVSMIICVVSEVSLTLWISCNFNFKFCLKKWNNSFNHNFSICLL